jgi:integrase
MPRPKSGSRLWLDKERDAWSIIDGRRVIRTGCGKSDVQGAKAALQAYSASHHSVVVGCDPLIADVLKVYSEEHLATKISAYSVSYDMDNLAIWWGTKPVSEITAENCRAYIAHRDRRTCSRRELGFLSAAATYWHKNRTKLSSIPVIVKPPAPEPRTRWLTVTEAARFLFAARDQRRVRRVFLIGWYTGTRHAAICGLRWDMIDLKTGLMLRRPPGVAETKKRTPPVRVGRRLLAHLRRWRRLDGPNATHLITFGGKPVRDVNDGWARARDRSGLSDDVTVHTLRHSRATHLMRQRVPVWEAAQSLGMSVEMLQRVYGHHNPDWGTGPADAR